MAWLEDDKSYSPPGAVRTNIPSMSRGGEWGSSRSEKGERGEPVEVGIRNKGAGKNKGSTRGKKKDQPTKVKGTKDDWWAKREMIQGNKDSEDDKSLNSSRDEERVDEAAVVERNRVRRKTTKAANQDQEIEAENEENIDNKDEGGCGRCGTIDSARMIECDWCGTWICIECSGLGDEGYMKKVSNATKKEDGLCWICPICIGKRKEKDGEEIIQEDKNKPGEERELSK